MDKDPEVQAVYLLPRVKKFIDSKKRRSAKTGKTYLSALVKLNGYTKKEHHHDSDSIIDALLKMKINVYDLLDGFISFLPTFKEGITANTIGNYVAALKSYFAANDIDVVPNKFKHKVTLPRKGKEKELAIDASDIRKILLSCSNRRLKAYLLVLCSSGLRADTEACSIRNCDIDFKSSPVKIHIRADYTKTKVARSVYLTDEAAYHLKQWQNFKNNNEPKELIFSAYDNDVPYTVEDTKRIANNIYFRLSVEFAKLLTVVGMDQRKETGIIEKRRHLITLHSLRRFTYSIINNQTNTAFAEFILGHSDSVYHNEKESMIKDLYLNKCMTALTILDYKTFEETGRSIEARIEQKEQEITILKMKEKQRDEEMTQLKDQMSEMREMMLTISKSGATIAVKDQDGIKQDHELDAHSWMGVDPSLKDTPEVKQNLEYNKEITKEIEKAVTTLPPSEMAAAEVFKLKQKMKPIPTIAKDVRFALRKKMTDEEWINHVKSDSQLRKLANESCRHGLEIMQKQYKIAERENNKKAMDDWMRQIKETKLIIKSINS